MRTLNRQRASIVYSWFWESGMVLTPNETARREAVLERSGVLRWADLSVMGFAEVGVQFATVLTSLAPGWAGSFDQRRRIQQLASIFHMQQYMLWPTRKHGHPKVYICLKTGATANDQVKAWCHALSVAKELRDEKGDDDEKRYERKIGILRATMDEMNRSFPGFASKLATKGWDLKTACIETCSGYRITVMLGEGHPGTIIIGERDGASEKRDRASEKLPGKIPGADRFGGNGDMAEIVGPGDAAKKGRDLDSSDISQKGYLEGKKVV